jgi:hypothetical protein
LKMPVFHSLGDLICIFSKWVFERAFYLFSAVMRAKSKSRIQRK